MSLEWLTKSRATVCTTKTPGKFIQCISGFVLCCLCSMLQLCAQCLLHFVLRQRQYLHVCLCIGLWCVFLRPVVSHPWLSGMLPCMLCIDTCGLCATL
jgi:hypothetical protein